MDIGRLDGCQWPHAILKHDGELTPVFSMRADCHVGSGGDSETEIQGAAKHFHFLLRCVLSPDTPPDIPGTSLRHDEFVNVDGRHKKRSVLFHELERFFVKQDSVLDGSCAGAHAHHTARLDRQNTRSIRRNDRRREHWAQEYRQPNPIDFQSELEFWFRIFTESTRSAVQAMLNIFRDGWRGGEWEDYSYAAP